jgi:hypothetical protein
MIHGGIEGFDGRVNGQLNADKNTHSKGNSYDRENSPSFMKTKMAEGNVF